MPRKCRVKDCKYYVERGKENVYRCCKEHMVMYDAAWKESGIDVANSMFEWRD